MTHRRIPDAHLLAIAIVLLAHTALAQAQEFVGSWTPHGVPVESAANEALAALPIADGSGGLFVVWRATSGIPAGEVRAMHLLTDGSPDPIWPGGGLIVGTYPGKLCAVSDGAGGVYVAFGTTSSVRCVRLLSTGVPAPGWSAAGASIGNSSFFSLHTTADRSVWAAYGTIQNNCPIGHNFCEKIVLVGARRFSADGVNLTGPFPGGFFSSHSADQLISFQATTHANGMWIYYETAFIGQGYRRHLAANPVNSIGVGFQVASSPFRDYSMHVAADPAGAVFITEGSYETSIVRRGGPGTPWASPWTYPLGAYGGAYPLDIIANPDGSLLSHSMVFETSPSPHIVDSFVQRILPNGTTDPAWPLQGVSTRGPALLYQGERILVTDGQGGALAVWEDTRGGEPDIFALAIRNDGHLPPGWHHSGTAICRRADSPQTGPRATHDALGDLFVTWIDRRNGTADVYAQKIAPDRPVPALVGEARGRWTGAEVELSWTLVGAGSGPWQVERSRDEVEWTRIGEAEPAPKLEGWKYIDRSARRGETAHYRLIGPEGVVTGADITVQVPGAALAIVRVSPNPADRFANVSLAVPVPSDVDISLVDVLGRTVVRRSDHVEAGAVMLRLDEVERLRSGLYWLRVVCAGNVAKARVLVSR